MTEYFDRFRAAILSGGLVKNTALAAAESAAREALAKDATDDLAVMRKFISLLVSRGDLANEKAQELLQKFPLFVLYENALRGGVASAQDFRAGLADLATVVDLSSLDETQLMQGVTEALTRRGVLTGFQASQLLMGRRKFNLGQYRILDQIGRGGMGQVFLAEHELMGRRVAVKVLPRKKSTEESEKVFRREIRMLGRLDHENLVRALDAGYDGKVFFLVTELVPGLDLNRQIKRHGVFDEMTAASVISQAASVLHYAHAEGVIHRDVKPGNIIVTDDGRVKLLDLGLAGSVIADEAMQLNRVVGTMDYIAPEQLLDPDNVGPSADIYSLGCTLYFTVTGQPLYPGGSRQEKAKRHLHEKPPNVMAQAPHVSKAFCRVIEGMLLKEPAERYQSMAEIIDELASWRPASLVPMLRGEEDTALGAGEVAGNESARQQGNSDWALGDADSLPPDGGVIVDQPGREEVSGGKPNRLLKVAGIAAVSGVGGGLLLAAIAAATGNQGFGGIVPLVGGVIISVVTAAGLFIRTVLGSEGD
jgi:tRNA A-37 threonylcarbamoyl transferase component Bud32